MIYELTDTSVEMTDTLGNKLGFYPVSVIEADSPAEALQAWRQLVPHEVAEEHVTITPIPREE